MTRRPWTPDELELLQALYPTVRAAEIAARLPGRTISQVLGQAWRRGLRKAPETIANMARGAMARPDHAGRATQFRKGQLPWNHGLKGYQAGGRSAETRFAPGQMPHNTKAVGEYRIVDGMLQRKIGTAKGSNSKRWRGVHELVWIATHGPVPSGHICVFKPGMSTTVLEEITADKVECISRAENMRRNSCHRYGKEIARLVQLRGALTRQINKRSQPDGQQV